MAIVWFLIIFTIIVVVHEFGHFIFAKMFNTKVLEFSIGFGPKLFFKKGKKTDFAIRAIPLGGYVKLAGEDELENIEDNDDPTLLFNKKPWQKLLISFAGPLFSFLLGIIVIAGSGLIYGLPQVQIENVLQNSPAEQAGLSSGDIIKKVNNDYVFDPQILNLEIREGKTITLDIIREGKSLEIELTPQKIPAEYMVQISNISGSTSINELDKINGLNQDIEVLNKMEPGDPISFSNKDKTIRGNIVNIQKMESRYIIGVNFDIYTNIIAKDYQIFEKDDQIIEIEGEAIDNGIDFVNTISRLNIPENDIMVELSENQFSIIKAFTENTINLKVLRKDKIIELQSNKENLIEIFSQPGIVKISDNRLKPSLVEIIPVSFGWAKTLMESVVQVIKQLFTGQTNTNEIAGPIGIATIIGQASKAGFESILNILALITINLGVINILPLPALDGGRIIFSLYEIIARRKVNPKIESLIHAIGFIILMGLMIFIAFNDITRFFN
ncbi:M50 family metallopeptidase [Geotoga petraea]|jgi:regulator of sigma E protease|uniref:PDZ domain-containing protein n=1 Tax=Geotoga petraea TaxID=28234 RepID=A0A1G6JWI0_9BACT|nr:site-2 protease family protein [Geotoga petraea]MDK2945679.1 regulator of sigma protease [Geotoga sp.]TGG88341.1 PDZ domain-containing protein [Geotoga petraea]SDC22981.1 regulator of sigma E protease [Geotoga petraea]